MELPLCTLKGIDVKHLKNTYCFIHLLGHCISMWFASSRSLVKLAEI